MLRLLGRQAAGARARSRSRDVERVGAGSDCKVVDGRDCLVVTVLVSVRLLFEPESATLCDVKNADLELAECLRGGGYLLQLFRLHVKFRECLGLVVVCRRLAFEPRELLHYVNHGSS